MKRITTEKPTTHPLEEAFGIESGTTMIEYSTGVIEPVVSLPDYDEKDNEIEGKLEEIYSVAMNQVMIVADEIERVEGKFKARMGEVTATMLNVALGAVREKTILKIHKDKLMTEKTNTAQQRGGVVNNNLVVTADRNEILKMLMGQEKEQNRTDGEE
jgi:hypothetical protein